MTGETAFRLGCNGAALAAILHEPLTPSHRGVIVVVGGPQYRIGGHRQFLILARELADAGFPVLRFDYRGMGDSDGIYLGFEHIDDDIAAAVDALTAHVPSVQEVILWGLCDAASAILFYAHKDPRITGIVLLNPWVRTEATLARAHLRHYYTRRLTSRQFWHSAFAGRVSPAAAVGSVIATISRALGKTPGHNFGQQSEASPLPLSTRMAEALASFRGKVLVILSGQDLTAREFEEVAVSYRWRDLLNNNRVTMRRLRLADHTFSRRDWREQVTTWTRDWLASW